MSSPNEPGLPRTGGSVSGSAAGNGADAGGVPPWQRGSAGRGPNPPSRASADQPTRADVPLSGNLSGHSPGADARLNRFMSGGSSSAVTESAHESEQQHPPTRNERTDMARTDSYGSELPDLSGPRPPQQPSPERSTPQSADVSTTATSRIQVGSRPRGPVRASMQIRRIDPWSALKVSLVLSVALFFVWMIAVAFLYLVLGGMGVWSKLNTNVGDLLTDAGGSAGGNLVSSGTVFGGAALIGLVNIVILTALATIGAFIYNLTTDLVGGVEVTLADRD